MTYHITTDRINFICDCGYEKINISSHKAGETVKRIHGKVCPNQKIIVKCGDREIVVRTNNARTSVIHTVSNYQFDFGKRVDRDENKTMAQTMKYEKEALTK